MRIDNVLVEKQFNNLNGHSYPGVRVKHVQAEYTADAAKTDGFYGNHIDRLGVEMSISEDGRNLLNGARKIKQNADGVVHAQIAGTGMFAQISGGNGTLLHENLVGSNRFEAV
ncbi:MAG: hypothetical protein E7294_02610 [Lachnospiraceae bacterium]|jgi:hypothetical protein|nr:hypothetical protein [Lachnospiraceae bacterium]